jgi:hypothetical protein
VDKVRMRFDAIEERSACPATEAEALLDINLGMSDRAFRLWTKGRIALCLGQHHGKQL